MDGNSRIHGGHHEAQKLSNTTLPSNNSRVTLLSLASFQLISGRALVLVVSLNVFIWFTSFGTEVELAKSVGDEYKLGKPVLLISPF